MNITIEHLCKSFLLQHQHKKLFDDFSVSITFDHVLALLGPSGSGKTTLLRLLAGLEIPEQGSILINGEAIPSDEASLERYRRKLGVVFQQQSLFPHLSALENVILPLKLVHHVPSLLAKKRAQEILEQLHLKEHQYKKPHQLSGGQAQRVAIARALVTSPTWLLLDEPTSSLDPGMKSEVLELILELRSRSIPILLVTHEIEFAKKCADQMIFLVEGSITYQGAMENFFKSTTGEHEEHF